MVYNRNYLPSDWGPSALNVTSQSSMSLTYDLPFFKSASGFEGKLLRGWQVNGISTLLTGFPFTPLLGSNRSGDGNTRDPDRPNLNQPLPVQLFLAHRTEWFNPNAFSVPTAGTYGDLGRGTYTGPGLADVDMSVFKNTNLSELPSNCNSRAGFSIC